MPTTQHRKFDLGMMRDTAPYLIPEGSVYNAGNMLFDKVGVARKRGGITGLGATATYDGDHLGALAMDDGTVRFYSSTGVQNIIYYWNQATGVRTAVGPVAGPENPEGGRPFQHYGFECFPMSDGTSTMAIPGWVAGATGSVAAYTFATPASCVVTAGDKRIVCAAGDNPLTKAQVGMFARITQVGPASTYIGRITALVDSTHFEVYPTPTVGFTAVSAFYTLSEFSQTGLPGAIYAQIGGKIGMSFQGRVLLGNITRLDSAGANRIERFARRVAFSTTLLEGDVNNTTVKFQGATWINSNAWPTLNYFDIPGNDALTAMTPTGFGDAIFFTAFRAFRLTGNLSTQFGTTSSVTWAVREIPNSVGCISERSMQRTPRGVIFAHDSGIYSTDGQSMQPLMYGRIQNFWNSLAGGGSFRIYGSALLRGNHYYICGTSANTPWGLLVNLDTLAWGSIYGQASAPASFLVNSGVQDPGDPTKVYGLKWWDTGFAAPSMTNGQLVRLDKMFDPTSANKSDSDNTPVGATLSTRAYSEDSPTMQKVWKQSTIEYLLTGQAGGASSVYVETGTGIDPAKVFGFASLQQNTLSCQDVYTITGATNASPIVLTVSATHAISAAAAPAWVHVSGVLGNTAANGPWRVQAVTGTTITLAGSAGNGNYSSGGTVMVFDTFDMGLSTALQPLGPGSNNSAVVYRFNVGDACTEFELRGITHSWEDRDPHVE
jgi:hypothetical protein